MWKKTKLIASILMCFCIFFITSCTTTEEERQRGQELEREARRIAEEHLLRKYGEGAQIEDVRVASRIDSRLYRRYTGSVTVIFTQDNRTSRIEIRNNIARDNHQSEIIEKDFTTYLQSIFSFNPQIVPESVAVNQFPASNDLALWSEEDFYDGNMADFITRITNAASTNTRSRITLLFGVTEESKSNIISTTKEEAMDLQTLMQGTIDITLAFYDANEFSREYVEEAILNYDEFLLNLLMEVGNIYRSEAGGSILRILGSFEKVHDYSQFSPIPVSIFHEGLREWGVWDIIEVSGYTVNGELFERADRFIVRSIIGDRRALEGIVQLINNNTITYGNRFGDDSHLYPEHRLVRFNVAAKFPQVFAANEEFVVVSHNAGSGQVDIVPFATNGDYLYFRMFRAQRYIIGVTPRS